MNLRFEDLRLPQSKPVLHAIKRLMDAGVPIEKIVECFSDLPEATHKILAIAEATHLIKEKAVSFNRLGIIYECAPDRFHANHKELQEMYEKSPDKYFKITKNNWDFFTHFISNSKTPKDFEFLYENKPKEFEKLRHMFH